MITRGGAAPSAIRMPRRSVRSNSGRSRPKASAPNSSAQFASQESVAAGDYDRHERDLGKEGRLRVAGVGIACAAVSRGIRRAARADRAGTGRSSCSARGRGVRIVRADEALAQGDLLDAGDLQPLPLLDGLDEVGGLEQRFVRARVEPGEAAAEELDVQLPRSQVDAVDVGDFQLAARRGLQAGGDLDHLVVVEVEAGDGVVRLGLSAASPRSRRAAVGVEFDHAVALRVLDEVGEDRGPASGVRPRWRSIAWNPWP